MKKIFVLFFGLFPLMTIYSQWDVSASMGLDFKSSSSYRDYVNSSFAPADNRISSFNSAVNFGGEVGYLFSKNFQLSCEYNILIDSYSTPVGPSGIYEISYTHHRPSVLAYYVLAGNGYKFKFGGGAGIRLLSLDEKIYSSTHYSSTGVGFIARADGNTLLSDNLYVLIGIDIRYDLPGEPHTSDNQNIVNFSTGETMNMNSIGVGIKLGITYTF